MNASQVKKQFMEFSAYLGTDARGIGFLKKLKDSFGEFKKRVATCEEKLRHAEEIADRMSSKLRLVESELQEAVREIQRVRQINDGLSLALSRMETDGDQHGSSNDESGGDLREAQVKQVIKRLLKLRGECPAAVASVGGKRASGLPLLTFSRESVADGWSHDDLWVLGATVALTSAVSGSVTIETDCTLGEIRTIHDKDSDESWGRLWWKWSKNLITPISQERVNAKSPRSADGYCNGMNKRGFNPYGTDGMHQVG